MGLQVKTTLSQSKDCKTITLVDTTGVFDADTNPTGYGSLQEPSGQRDIGDITGATLQVFKPKSTTPYTNTLISQVDAQMIAANTLNYYITNAILGGSSTTSLIDGVYKTNYIVFFSNTNNTSVTNNSNIVTVNDGADYEGATHLSFNGGATIYEIASIVSDTITLTTNYSGSTAILNSTYAGYCSTSYIACKCLINNCIHKKVANLSTEDCGCGCKSNDICENLAFFFSIQANMDDKNYTEAQQIIDILTRICLNDDCGCT